MPTMYELCTEHTKYFSYFKAVCLYEWQHAASLNSHKILGTSGYPVLILDNIYANYASQLLGKLV